MAPSNTYSSHALTLHDCATWPAVERERWLDAFSPERIIGDPPWVRQTQYQVAGVYTRYRAAAGRHGWNGICAEGVRAYVRELQTAGIRVRTIAGYVRAIQRAATIIQPETPLDWLVASCRRLEGIAERTPKRKTGVFVAADAILNFGLSCCGEARKLGLAGGWSAVQLFRDGLFLAFGVAGPERRRALAGLRIGDLDLERRTVTYAPTAMKTKVESIRTYPESVANAMAEWLTIWRPRCQPDHDAVWLALGGGPACDGTLYAAMRKLTAERAPWGFAITPHRLRDAAATLCVEASPEAAKLAPLLLGHSREATTREYTESAVRLEASRQMPPLIKTAEARVAQLVRESTSSTVALHPRSRRRAPAR